MKKRLVFSIAATLLLMSGCSNNKDMKKSEKIEAKVLNVGCSSTFIPYESVDVSPIGDKIYKGMNIDILNSIANQLGYELAFQDMPFKSLIGAVQAERVDIFSGGMKPTEARRKSVDFSEIFFYPRNAIVFRKGENIKSLEDLEGKIIVYVLGTNYQEVAESVNNATAVGIQGSPDCVEEVKAERADAAIIDGAGAVEFLKSNENLDLCLLDKTDDCFAFGFPKESPYIELFNTKLVEMINNGELDKIISKYLSVEFTGK